MQIRNNYLGMGVWFFYKMKIKNTTLLEQLKNNRSRGQIDTPNTFCSIYVEEYNANTKQLFRDGSLVLL